MWVTQDPLRAAQLSFSWSDQCRFGFIQWLPQRRLRETWFPYTYIHWHAFMPQARGDLPKHSIWALKPTSSLQEVIFRLTHRLALSTRIFRRDQHVYIGIERHSLDLRRPYAEYTSPKYFAVTKDPMYNNHHGQGCCSPDPPSSKTHICYTANHV